MTIGTVHSTHEALATFAGEETHVTTREVLSLSSPWKGSIRCQV